MVRSMAVPTGSIQAHIGDLPAEEWPFESRFADVSGNRIHYIDEGAGPVLLFVHVGLWSFVWRDVITRLRSDFRCIALDFPGTGYSVAAESHQHTLAASADVLGTFVDQLQLHDIIMVVHDLGGPVGLSLAMHRPEEIRGLVIAQTFGWPLRDYKWVTRMLRFVSGPQMSKLNRKRNLVARMTSGRFGVGRHLSRAGRAAFLAPFASEGPRATWTKLIADALNIDELMARVDHALNTSLRQVPALTIFGSRNDPYDWQGRYECTFDNTTSVAIEKGYHFPSADNPEKFASSVLDWWNEVEAT